MLCTLQAMVVNFHGYEMFNCGLLDYEAMYCCDYRSFGITCHIELQDKNSLPANGGDWLIKDVGNHLKHYMAS